MFVPGAYISTQLLPKADHVSYSPVEELIAPTPRIMFSPFSLHTGDAGRKFKFCPYVLLSSSSFPAAATITALCAYAYAIALSYAVVYAADPFALPRLM